MEIERAEVKLMNLEFLKRLRDGIEDGHIPEWLLLEVLTKLPAKLVCRTKLVSKQWLSLMSEPSFIRTYISRASLLSQHWNFISLRMHHKGATSLNFQDYILLNDIYSQQVLKPSYCVLPLPRTQQPRDQESYQIAGVSNGLVLYGSRVPHVKLDHYYICNPVTQRWIALPPIPCGYSFEVCGFLTRVKDGVLVSFRVIRLEHVKGQTGFLSFRVFISETGEWKIFTVNSEREVSHALLKGATALNGILYWVSMGQCVIAYDPYRSPERIRVIELPSDITSSIQRFAENDDPEPSLLVACEGKLRYFEVPGFRISSFKLWVLDDYSSDNWCLIHDISYRDVQYDLTLEASWTIAPIDFHPFDSDIVYLGYDDVLVAYNIKTEKLEVQGKWSRAEWKWSFLFVIPPWPIAIPC